ncbi:MAG: sugar ABC transporter substrate-binding protein [Microbacterium sp. 69-10]|uniref:ABC transporter substrate-binding protein n=1 Tax=Microbacterium sp. 69-10 TaxID=1895783 RepID=UPI000965D29F|nr:extracellular solute-binding protein [Microbacterium sp. 69-10]OJU40598.1 MAG: sugar ABC transporter substrate-binding protein [Microbacterium sp. 69-10]
MRSPRKVLLAGAATVAVVGMLAGCSPAADDSSSGGKIQLRVATFPPGADAAAYEAFAAQEKQFEALHKDIDIIGVEYEWKGPTFAVQLAGGSLPDVFTVPFTDTKTLLENGQLTDVTDAVKELGYTDKFNPVILDGVTGADGHIYGFPRQAYAMGLHYNRDLFKAAGLDPDKPPTTWDEVRAYAKQITEKTGKAGYAQMAAGNTGGWQLTAATVARGGRTQTDDADGSATSSIDNDATRAALQFLHDVRWEDKSFGSKFDLDWGTINQEFAAGNLGMYTSGSDVYTALVRDFGMKPEMYGLGVVPVEGKDPGTLGGGDVAVISPTIDAKAKDAATTWIDWYYMQKLMDKDAAITDAKTLADSGQAVGTPLLPVLSRDQYEESLKWIEPYINVPRDQMSSFIDEIWEQTPVGEPKKKTQEVYALLDTVVQSVLTQQNADIDGLLKKAQTDAQALLDR